MIVYRSFYEAIKELPKENQAEVWGAIFEYSFEKTEPELSGISKTVFKLIKPQLDANLRKYETGLTNGKKGAEHGKKGGRPRKQNNPLDEIKKPLNNPQKTPKKPSNDNVNDNVNDKYIGFISFVNSTLGRDFRGTDKSKSQFKARLKDGYTFEDLERVVFNASKDEFHKGNGYKYLTPEFLTRPDKVESFKTAPIAPPKVEPTSLLSKFKNSTPVTWEEMAGGK